MPAIARMARSYKWHRAGAGTSCAVGADSSAMLFGGPYPVSYTHLTLPTNYSV